MKGEKMIKNPEITALVPMKGHSERVPLKNIRSFAGKPLCCHILDTLSEISVITKIIINTDSDTIKKLTCQYPKVRFHDRPAEICGGHIPMNTILDYDIAHSEGEIFLQTHSTNPLLSRKTIEKAILKYCENIEQYDSLFSAKKLQQRLYDKDFLPLNHNPQILQNTQDLDPIYEENSCIYIFSRQSFIDNKRNRIGKKPYIFIMSQQESYDIDTEDDFSIAEKMFLIQHDKEGSHA